MTITFIGLIIYAVFLFAYAIFSAFAVYHLFQFGYVGDLCRPIAVLYIVISVGIVTVSLTIVLSSIIRG